jgi:hypothetical protein
MLPILYLLRSHTLQLVHQIVEFHFDSLTASSQTRPAAFLLEKDSPEASAEVAVRKRKVVTVPRRRKLLLRPEWIGLHGPSQEQFPGTRNVVTGGAHIVKESRQKGDSDNDSSEGQRDIPDAMKGN